MMNAKLVGLVFIIHHSSFRISFPASGHHQPDLLLARPLRINLADDAPVVDDEQAVGERRDLFEFGGDEQDGAALVAQTDELAVYELDGPDVNAARRLRDQKEFGAQLELATDDELLLVAARKRAGGKVRVRGAHVEVAYDFKRPVAYAREVEQRAERNGGLAVVDAEDGVFGEVEVEQQAPSVSVFRHVRDAEFVALARARARDVAPA